MKNKKEIYIEIQLNDGDRLKVTETYSSYGADEQEETFQVVAKRDKDGVMRLYKTDGNRFYTGINSVYRYKILSGEEGCCPDCGKNHDPRYTVCHEF